MDRRVGRGRRPARLVEERLRTTRRGRVDIIVSRGDRRERGPMRKQIFARKPLSMLLEEMTGENRLKRVLGPVGLTSLGVGAIIGTGIFVLTGEAAARQGRAGAVALVGRRRHHLHLRRALLRRVRLHGAGRRARPTRTPMRRWASCSPGSSAGTWCSNTPSAPRPSPTAGRTTSRTSQAVQRRHIALARASSRNAPFDYIGQAQFRLDRHRSSTSRPS